MGPSVVRACGLSVEAVAAVMCQEDQQVVLECFLNWSLHVAAAASHWDNLPHNISEGAGWGTWEAENKVL